MLLVKFAPKRLMRPSRFRKASTRYVPQSSMDHRHSTIDSLQSLIYFDCTSPQDEPEKRFHHFTTQLLPAVLKSAVQSTNAVVFVPSSFDFIRVHNWFRKNAGVSFTVLSEFVHLTSTLPTQMLTESCEIGIRRTKRYRVLDRHSSTVLNPSYSSVRGSISTNGKSQSISCQLKFISYDAVTKFEESAISYSMVPRNTPNFLLNSYRIPSSTTVLTHLM